jgi:hypothetical protein
MTLIDGVPEALSYCNKVLEHPDSWRAFPEETWQALRAGVFAASSRDSQGERITHASLIGMAKQLLHRPVFVSVEHDPRRHPVGRILTAEVFAHPDGVHFLAGVVAYYDPEKLQRLAEYPWTPSDTALPIVPSEPGPTPWVLLAINEHEITPEVVAALLEGAPDTVSQSVRAVRRKAVDPIRIVESHWPFWLLLAIYAQSFLKESGTLAARRIDQTIDWLLRIIRARMSSGSGDLLFVIASKCSDCRVEFVLTDRDVESRERAIRQLQDGARRAENLIATLIEAHPMRLVCTYDAIARCWHPQYMITKYRGVMVREPEKIDPYRYPGFSVGGEVEMEDDENDENDGS